MMFLISVIFSILSRNVRGNPTKVLEMTSCAPVSEPGVLRFSKNVSKIEIPGEFLKMVS